MVSSRRRLCQTPPPAKSSRCQRSRRYLPNVGISAAFCAIPPRLVRSKPPPDVVPLLNQLRIRAVDRSLRCPYSPIDTSAVTGLSATAALKRLVQPSSAGANHYEKAIHRHAILAV